MRSIHAHYQLRAPACQRKSETVDRLEGLRVIDVNCGILAAVFLEGQLSGLLCK
jgi:2-polyprenyl-3-methyl-5-hydroxy-6-metoxy-1,4-benzoquinol methylase